MNKKKKFTLISSAATIGVISVGAYYYFAGAQISRRPYWSSSPKKTPPSNQNAIRDVKILKDYFLSDRFKGVVDYDVHLRSQGPRNWDQLFRKNLQEMTFSTKRYPPTPKPRPFFLEHFLKRLRKEVSHKVKERGWPESTYQADLVIRPTYHYNLDPDSTLTDTHYLKNKKEKNKKE